MKLNYVAASNQEKDTRDKERYCMSEKKSKEPIEEEKQVDNIRRINYCDYEEQREESEELYTVDKRKQQDQAETLEKRLKLQSESK
ncbi:3137_t:CDS:2 [Cetraspora pellucida]|uniref:3137_t:CDS:1 n=1 Tax=Cetraspora pellucida TaxID=1433469 RepID=A0ACA9KJJ0_9GLOM|nr:3137_t:CDS:2 [Cetraspora pellucida]